MGVHGLWRLLEPSGRPVPVDSLRGRALAVDVSIWLHQSAKGVRDGRGAAVPNAHLLVLFRRLCKLLHCGVRPVFVFDGGYPALKTRTVIDRQTRRARAKADVDGLRRRLLEIISKTAKRDAPASTANDDDLFKLPPKPLEQNESSNSESETETKTVPERIRYDLHTLDVDSKEFGQLSARERHDVLTELKETRKESSWGRLDELPKQSDDFSDFQMKRLLKRRRVQTRLEETEKEIGGSHLTLNDLETLLNEEGIDTKIENVPTRRIASNENARYLLVKDINKALQNAKSKDDTDSKDETSVENGEVKTVAETSLRSESKKESVENSDTLGKEYDDELKYAIELSLQDEVKGNGICTKQESAPILISEDEIKSESSDLDHSFKRMSSTEFSDRDYNSELEEAIELSLQVQHKKIDDSNPTSSFAAAKGFMLEFGGLTEQGIKDIFDSSTSKSVSTTKNSLVKPFKRDTDIGKIIQNSNKNEEKLKSESSSSDDDFEDVPDKCIAKEQTTTDMFADVFEDVSGFKKLEDAIVEKLIEKASRRNSEVENSSTNLVNEHSEPSKNNETEDSEEKNEKEVSESIEDIEDSNEVNHPSPQSDVEVIENESPVVPNESIPDKTPAISSDEVISFVNDIEHQSEILEMEKNKLDRLGRNVTEEMTKDAKQLLRLFGIPYIVAPMEAEAQCAFLESIELTDGTITDDSDIWLFGGKTVYRNFFNQQKHVLQFVAENIEKSFRLRREDFILLALLVGSDYTMGITGIGPVTALEILAAFPTSKLDVKPPYDELLDGLRSFKTWLKSDRIYCHTALRKKLKNVSLSEEFPNHKVVEAYLIPDVERSEEIFSWGTPDLVSLREYTREKFGWSKDKTAEILLPVMKRFGARDSQLTMHSFFNTDFKVDATSERFSKRVKKAIDNFSKDKKEGQCEVASEENSERLEERRAETEPKKRKRNNNRKDKEVKGVDAPGTSKTIVKRPKREDFERQIVYLGGGDEVIPQRELDKNQVLQNKLKAIEIFRKSKKGPGFTKKRKKVILQPKKDAELSESSSSD